MHRRVFIDMNIDVYIYYTNELFVSIIRCLHVMAHVQARSLNLNLDQNQSLPGLHAPPSPHMLRIIPLD